jgi:hypothetical protein
MPDEPRKIPFQERVEALATDTAGAPLITECPAAECPDLDLWSMECAGGKAWVVVCGSGHMAFLIKKED